LIGDRISSLKKLSVNVVHKGFETFANTIVNKTFENSLIVQNIVTSYYNSKNPIDLMEYRNQLKRIRLYLIEKTLKKLEEDIDKPVSIKLTIKIILKIIKKFSQFIEIK
jgi:hypothetical protein